jgi:membrane fusion protein, multidrug efflux system
VQVGQPLLTVVDLTHIYVTANFKETQLAGIHVGSPAEFTVDAYPGRTFHGHVASLSPGTGAVFSLLPPENATGNFTKVVQRVPIRIASDSGADANHPLRIGMSVNATVTTGS